MKRIWLIAPPESPVVAEVERRLSEHFGASQVRLGGAGDQWRNDDAVVLFFETPSAAWSDPQRRAQAWAEIADPCIEQCLAADATLIPVLVNGALMPTAAQLPSAVAPLSYKHALPIRSNVQLPRDVGRLVEDLESQLKFVVGERFPLELWLIPLGVLTTAIGAIYSGILFRDVRDWSFAYQTVEDFRRGAWNLGLFGPGMLGAGMLMLTGGLWWRRSRFVAQQRAEHFRSGAGTLPRPVNNYAWGCLCAGAAAAGWGAPAAVVASGLGAWALWSMRGKARRSAEFFLVALGLAIGGLGVAWTLTTWQRGASLCNALTEYEAGRKERLAGRNDSAIKRLTTAVRRYPPYANAYLRLAQIHRDQEQPDEALAAVNEAIVRYPATQQGMFGPSERRATQALELRGELHDAKDDAEAAQRDRDARLALTQSLNLFGGLFRFWESGASMYWDDSWDVSQNTQR